MPRALETGWAFPLRRTDAGQLAIVTGDELIAQSIWLILATAPGERAHRPEFGCGIHHLVFAADDAATHGRVADAVHDALVHYEPRIDVLSVDVRSAAGDRGTLVVEVDYVVRATSATYSLAYQFALAGEEPA